MNIYHHYDLTVRMRISDIQEGGALAIVATLKISTELLSTFHAMAAQPENSKKSDVGELR